MAREATLTVSQKLYMFGALCSALPQSCILNMYVLKLSLAPSSALSLRERVRLNRETLKSGKIHAVKFCQFGLKNWHWQLLKMPVLNQIFHLRNWLEVLLSIIRFKVVGFGFLARFQGLFWQRTTLALLWSFFLSSALKLELEFSRSFASTKIRTTLQVLEIESKGFEIDCHLFDLSIGDESAEPILKKDQGERLNTDLTVWQQQQQAS